MPKSLLLTLAGLVVLCCAGCGRKESAPGLPPQVIWAELNTHLDERGIQQSYRSVIARRGDDWRLEIRRPPGHFIAIFSGGKLVTEPALAKASPKQMDPRRDVARLLATLPSMQALGQEEMYGEKCLKYVGARADGLPLTLWLSEAHRFPVRVTVKAAATDSDTRYTLLKADEVPAALFDPQNLTARLFAEFSGRLPRPKTSQD